jgi:hypothetical protein
MTTFTLQDFTATPEEEEAWRIMEAEALKDLEEKKQANRKTVWIGEFEFFDAQISSDKYQFCLIHRLHEIRTCTEKELETGLDGEQLDWVVPDEYKGEIAFSQGFMRNLGGNIRKFDKEMV